MTRVFGEEWLIGSFFALFLGLGVLNLTLHGLGWLALLVVGILALLWWDVSR